ncbi:hypothetical protein [Nostoc linckia]|uniref:hypothetical protein n=2 Tax=Nostoc linckia TaxID=92942 RepID=UPI00117C072E|nr:hypothetical protein [Nostoc linckia]
MPQLLDWGFLLGGFWRFFGVGKLQEQQKVVQLFFGQLQARSHPVILLQMLSSLGYRPAQSLHLGVGLVD